jgi:hypothetical protein
VICYTAPVTTPLRFKPATQAAWRKVGEEMIVLDLKTTVYYSLNETAAFIWERLEAGDSLEKAAAAFGAEYGQTPARALADVRAVAARLRKDSLLVPA